MSSPRLVVLGGGREVGANSFLLELDGARLLLDAGSHPRHEGAESLPRFELARDPDAILITHAHLDHVGGLPSAVARWPRGRIYWSRATEMLSVRQLHAAVAVMRKEQEAGRLAGPLLFGHDDVETLGWRGWPLMDGQPTRMPTNARVMVTPFASGHVLGSQGFVIESASARVVYTGDVCGHARELQPGMAPPAVKADILILEGTYGGTPEYSGDRYEDEVTRFASGVERVLRRGGSVLVPAFALGRTQEIVAMLRRLMGQGKLPRVPVRTSGLGRAMSEVHDRCVDEPSMRPRKWRLARWPRVLEAADLLDLRRILEKPSIHVLTSGMMTAGTSSALAAEAMIGDERHGIFFVGWTDPAELGHRVQHAPLGEWIEFRRGRPMTQRRTDAVDRFWFSGHADRRRLLQVVDHFDPEHVVLVHGEPAALEWLAENASPRRRVHRPATGETLTF
ncbi:MAG TPA: MBL fold metallo-hydrolase [Candidatus Eisenbacteria bacterium]